MSDAKNQWDSMRGMQGSMYVGCRGDAFITLDDWIPTANDKTSLDQLSEDDERASRIVAQRIERLETLRGPFKITVVGYGVIDKERAVRCLREPEDERDRRLGRHLVKVEKSIVREILRRTRRARDE